VLAAARSKLEAVEAEAKQLAEKAQARADSGEPTGQGRAVRT